MGSYPGGILSILRNEGEGGMGEESCEGWTGKRGGAVIGT